MRNKMTSSGLPGSVIGFRPDHSKSITRKRADGQPITAKGTPATIAEVIQQQRTAAADLTPAMKKAQPYTRPVAGEASIAGAVQEAREKSATTPARVKYTERAQPTPAQVLKVSEELHPGHGRTIKGYLTAVRRLERGEKI